MPLTECKECGKQISAAAFACPHCGLPQPPATQAARRFPFALLFFIAVVLVLVATALVFDSALYLLPEPYYKDIHAVDWKEMLIGIGGLVFALVVLILGSRWAFPSGHRMRGSVPWISFAGAFGASCMFCLFSRFEIHAPSWLTRNEVVYLAKQNREEGRVIRFRYLLLVQNEKLKQDLSIRIVKVDWDALAGGTKVKGPDDTELTVKSDLVGVKLSLEVRNTSPSEAITFKRPPYIGTTRGVVFKELHSPLHGFAAGGFLPDGISLTPNETKILQLESGMEGYDEVRLAGDLFVMHHDFEKWREPLTPVPSREVLFRK
jgi:hypothetical protein